MSPHNIIFATNNAHKLEELRQIAGTRFNILSLNDIGCHDDIPETAPTIEGNARQKAIYIAEHYGIDCFSDDTGLEVDALNGQPGVHTARFAGQPRSDSRNIAKLLGLLDGVPHHLRTARFRTVICYARRRTPVTTATPAHINDFDLHTFEGVVEGHIATEPHGDGGFGYDPVFAPIEKNGLTMAQLTPEQKNAISHRGRATAKLLAFLQTL